MRCSTKNSIQLKFKCALPARQASAEGNGTGSIHYLSILHMAMDRRKKRQNVAYKKTLIERHGYVASQGMLELRIAGPTFRKMQLLANEQQAIADNLARAAP